MNLNEQSLISENLDDEDLKNPTKSVAQLREFLGRYVEPRYSNRKKWREQIAANLPDAEPVSKLKGWERDEVREILLENAGDDQERRNLIEWVMNGKKDIPGRDQLGQRMAWDEKLATLEEDQLAWFIAKLLPHARHVGNCPDFIKAQAFSVQSSVPNLNKTLEKRKFKD